MEEKNVKKTKGSAYSQPDYIKPKSKWTKKTTIWVIVIAVIVLGILAIIGGENGWFKTQDMINGKLILDDYSTIEVSEADVRVSDDTIENYKQSIISAETTYEQVEEGVAEDGDEINLDYSGVLVGEEEPFEGGTAEGSTLTLGSGTMIDGFEDQIIGHEVGETFDISVTFPEDYSTAELAGKDAVFTITINSKRVADVPEMTDELVLHYTTEHSDTFDEPISTVADLEEYYRDRVYNSYLETAIMEQMEEKANVVYYNEADLASMTAYNQNFLSYYGSQYGLDADSMAQMFYGAENAADYVDTESKSLLKQTMIFDRVAQDQGIEVTDAEVDEALEGHMNAEEYVGTLDEFKEASGEAFLFLVKETEVLGPKVMDYLKGNVVFVEAPEEETSSESVSEAASEVQSAAEKVSEAASEAVSEVQSAAEKVSEAASEAVSEVQSAAEKVSEAASE